MNALHNNTAIHLLRIFLNGFGLPGFRGLSSVYFVFICVFLLTASRAGAQVTFEYSHTEGEQWRLTSVVDEQVLIDGELIYQTEILNKISAEVLEGQGADGRLHNRYQIAEKLTDSDLYGWSAEYQAVYNRDVRGFLTGLPPDSLVPTVRDVPVFPDRPLFPGDSWEADGTEVFSLEPTYGIDETVMVRFTADYRYAGPDELDGKDLEQVELGCRYAWNPDPDMMNRMNNYSFYPVELTGEFRQTIWWDSAKGRNYASDGFFSYTYLMNDGQTHTFTGRSRGRAVYAEPLDREALVREIEDFTGKSARIVDEGVSITLENLHFVPDQPVLLPGEEEKLEDIAVILRRYADRDVLVAGHTARVDAYRDGQLLSEQRAEAVAGFLTKQGIRDETQIMTRGYGHTRPVGDNSTEEGRRQNRRVEIIIQEN